MAGTFWAGAAGHGGDCWNLLWEKGVVVGQNFAGFQKSIFKVGVPTGLAESVVGGHLVGGRRGPRGRFLEMFGG